MSKFIGIVFLLLFMIRTVHSCDVAFNFPLSGIPECPAVEIDENNYRKCNPSELKNIKAIMELAYLKNVQDCALTPFYFGCESEENVANKVDKLVSKMEQKFDGELHQSCVRRQLRSKNNIDNHHRQLGGCEYCAWAGVCGSNCSRRRNLGGNSCDDSDTRNDLQQNLMLTFNQLLIENKKQIKCLEGANYEIIVEGEVFHYESPIP